MATIQEMQKARELMKNWLDLKTAVAQARTPVTPTSQINQDRLAQNQASRQANPVTPITPTQPAPITPAPIVNAPVDQTTGLSKPLEPVTQPVQQAPVTPATPVQAEVKAPEVKPVVASQKTEAPVDYTQAKGREQEIINNLNTFKAQNMTPEQIMKASDYQNATPEKQALIEPYLKQQVPTASAMYNNIVAKADIPDEQKTSLPFKIAQNRYTKASSYSTMTPSQLANEMNNSRFIQGSQAYEDVKAMNPKLIQDTENLRIVNGSKQNIFSYVNNPDGTKVKVNNLEKTFAEDYMDNFWDAIKQLFAVQTPEQIRAIIRTPDAAQAEDKAFELEWKIDEIDKLIEESDKKVEESLAWSGASGQRIQLEKSAQREKLEKDKRSIEKEYNRYANKANNIITQNTTLYLNSQAQKEKQATALLPILQDQYKTAQAKAQAEQALNDPAKAIKSVMDEYKKLGIPFTSTVQSRLAEFKASGKPLEQFLTEMSQNIQASPAYQKYQALQQGQMSDVQKMKAQQDFELKKIGLSKEAKDTKPEFKVIWKNADGSDKYGWVDASTKTVTPYGETGSTTIPDWKSLFDVLGKNVGTYEGNRGYDLAWNLWDPLPAGGNWTVKSVDTAGEQVGSIFIGGKGKKPYGNTVVMQDENGNEIRYSHLQNIGVKPWDILGFGDIVWTRGNTGNVKGANGETLTAEQLKAGRWAHVDIEIKSKWADGKLKLLSNAEQVNFLKWLKAGGDRPLADQKFTQFNQTTSKFYSNPQVKSFEDALNAGGDMIASLKSANWPWDVGAVFSFMKSLDPASVVKEWEFKLARESGWLDAKFDNLYGKIINGEQLTDEQRKAFGKISFEYIKSKWRMYDTKYNDMIKVLKNQWIPESYYPTRMTDYIKQYENGWSWAQNTGATQENTTLSITPEQKSKFDALYSRIPK